MTLGLHMIVLNEEEFLRALLEHLSVWVDEMVIVDTGSTDRTVEIAREFTPLVYPITWQMDFGKARNFGLERASTDWVLQVDADEWPTTDLLHWLRNYLREPKPEIWGVLVCRENLIDGKPIGALTYEWHVRMFQPLHCRFVGSIHERLRISPASVTVAPRPALLLHHKTGERQKMQNERYRAWPEQRAITGEAPC